MSEYQYDLPLQSPEHAAWCRREAARRYCGRIISDEVGMIVIEQSVNGLRHTDDVLRAISRYNGRKVKRTKEARLPPMAHVMRRPLDLNYGIDVTLFARAARALYRYQLRMGTSVENPSSDWSGFLLSFWGDRFVVLANAYRTLAIYELARGGPAEGKPDVTFERLKSWPHGLERFENSKLRRLESWPEGWENGNEKLTTVAKEHT